MAFLRPKLRVLVVDDSLLMRKMISQIIDSQLDMEVVGVAKDGLEALGMARSLSPDVITLDVEMPRVNGLQFLEQIMPEQPQKVLMLSSLTSAGAEATFQCLQRGAIDFLTKPSGSISLDIGDLSHEIVSKVRSVAAARVQHPSHKGRASVLPALPKPTVAPKPKEPLLLVTIASSTGGPPALSDFLPFLPTSLEVGYLLVQHLPEKFSALLASRLNTICALEVREAVEGERPVADTVLVAPGGKHLCLTEEGSLSFSDAPSLWGVRPAADVLMPSVAKVWRERTIGVVLTGMGRDGSLGVRAISQAGGVSLAQDEETSMIYGMPRVAWETGCVKQQVPLPEMANTLVQLIKERLLILQRSRKRIAS